MAEDWLDLRSEQRDVRHPLLERLLEHQLADPNDASDALERAIMLYAPAIVGHE
jgi:hypothetical protein